MQSTSPSPASQLLARTAMPRAASTERLSNFLNLRKSQDSLQPGTIPLPNGQVCVDSGNPISQELEGHLVPSGTCTAMTRFRSDSVEQQQTSTLEMGVTDRDVQCRGLLLLG